MANQVVAMNEQERAFVTQVADTLGLKYGIELLVERVRSQVHCAKGQVATNADVAMVLTEAMAKHLDPLKGGVYAFKSKDGSLVIGTSKQGFQQALCSQPTFRDLTYRHPETLKSRAVVTSKGRKEITYFDYSTCVVKKHFKDGTDALIEGTAYFDEEFNEASSAWVKNPKRMLDTRALCIASANAYGWGAYEPEEAAKAMEVPYEVETDEVKTVQAQKPTGASRAQKALAKAEEKKVERIAEIAGADVVEVVDLRADFIEQMKRAQNRQELIDVWHGGDPSVTSDPEIIALSKELSAKLK